MSVIVERNQYQHIQNQSHILNPQSYYETNFNRQSILRIQCPNYQINDIQSPSNSKWKSQLCKRFISQNFCPYGSKCQFAHGVQELRCNSNQHSKYKTKKCMSWQNNGYCRFQARCNFLHEKEREKIQTSKLSSIYDIQMRIQMVLEVKKQSRLLSILKE